ncbi:hypothetical protein GQ457_13G017350 [Hibiscus cannabinus]
MEIAMICANINEDREATMAIADVLELQHYVELEDMVHMAIKIERQNKRKPYKSNPSASSSRWNFEHPKNIPPISKESLPKPKQTLVEVNKTKPMDNHEWTRNIRCFKCLGRGHISSQCPNKNAMLVLDNGDIMSDHEEEEKEVPSPPKEENLEEEELIMPTGEIHVMKKVLSFQTKEEDKEQRENIFHTRCRVEKEVCSLIIYSGSCTNVARTFLINEIGLKTYKHPNPYRLQWLNNGGELKKKVIHDGYTNCYPFKHRDKLVNLTPLTPKQVKRDQVQMKKYIENFKVKLQRTQDKERSKVTHDENRPIMKKCDPTHENIRFSTSAPNSTSTIFLATFRGKKETSDQI